jgi:hypothetical protein
LQAYGITITLESTVAEGRKAEEEEEEGMRSAGHEEEVPVLSSIQ